MPQDESQHEFSMSLKPDPFLQEILCQHWSVGTTHHTPHTTHLLTLWHLLTVVCQGKSNWAVQERKTLSSESLIPANMTYFILDLEIQEYLCHKEWEPKHRTAISELLKIVGVFLNPENVATGISEDRISLTSTDVWTVTMLNNPLCFPVPFPLTHP